MSDTSQEKRNEIFERLKKVLTTIVKAEKPMYNPDKTKLKDLKKHKSSEN